MDVYVRDLSEDISEADLRKLFGVFGEVRSVRITMDLATGKPKGALVDMVSDDSAEQAIAALNGKTVRDTSIHVSRNPRRSVSDSRG